MVATAQAPQRGGGLFYSLMKHVFMGPLLRLLGRPTVHGKDHVPVEGGALIASNHLAVADSFFMPLVIKRRVTFPAKKEYFTAPGIKGKLQKFFFSAAGQVPIDRTSGSAANAALETCKRLLRDGNLVGIYPEGTRSPDGRMYRGKTGVARLALETGVPIVPVVMHGSDDVNPIGSRMWRPAKVTVAFGPALHFSAPEGELSSAEQRSLEREITDQVMRALKGLSGQEYVDLYAANVKNHMDRTGKSADAAIAEIQGGSAHPPKVLD